MGAPHRTELVIEDQRVMKPAVGLDKTSEGTGSARPKKPTKPLPMCHQRVMSSSAAPNVLRARTAMRNDI